MSPFFRANNWKTWVDNNYSPIFSEKMQTPHHFFVILILKSLIQFQVLILAINRGGILYFPPHARSSMNFNIYL